MAQAQNVSSITKGTEVYSADGEKLGKVSSADGSSVTVEKGFLFPTDFTIPMSAFTSVDGKKAYLGASKEEAMRSEWGGQVSGGTWTTTATSGYQSTSTAGGANLSTNERTTIDDRDNIVVAVHEEELVATKREREAGEVTIAKSVVEEQRTIEVPITEERVQVTRRAVDREATAGEVAFDGATISVPLTTEEVELQKRVHVTEELEIDREKVQTSKQVSGTVRKEVVDVNEMETNASLTRTDDRSTSKKS